jgi:hypothetical protein
MIPPRFQFLLSRMETAHRQTRRQLDLIERQIAGRAERLTITKKAKSRSHSRGRSNWSRSDEEAYQDHYDRLAFERRNEVGGLLGKLLRQENAIAAVRTAAVKDRCGRAGRTNPSTAGL